MARTIPAPNAQPKARDQFWLDHLRACREQGQTLKAYAHAQGLSVSTLYGARSALKRRGVLTEPACALSPRGPAPAAPAFVPVRIPTPGAAFRVHLPNGVVVEVPVHAERAACATVLDCASRLS